MHNDLATVTLVLAIAVVPGLAVLLASRQRGWVLVAAPLVTYGVLTLGGWVASAAGVPWTLWTLLATTVLVAGAVTSASRLVPRVLQADPTDEQGPTVGRAATWGVVAAATVGGALGAAVLRRGMGSLDAVVQDWDGIFHGAVVTWIIDAQDLGQSSLAQLNNRETASTFYYPNGWHGLAAAGRDLGIDSVPRLIDANVLLIPVFLAFGIAALVLRITKDPVAAGAAAIFATMPTALVFDLLWRGPVIPFAVGLVLVPAFMVLLARTLSTRTPEMIVVTGIAAGGVVGVHPSGVYTTMIFLVPWLVQRWISSRRRIGPDLLAGVGIGLVALLTALGPLRAALAAGNEARQDWPAVMGPRRAAFEALFLDHASPAGPQWTLVVLAVLSLLVIWKIRALWWFWVSGAVALVLFVVSAAYDLPVTEDLTAPWWNDRWRFAAMVAIFVVVAAGIAVSALSSWAADLVSRRAPQHRRAAAASTVGVVAVVVLATTGGGYHTQNSDRLVGAYQSGDLVDQDDFDLWHRAAEIVPEGQMVMNDPINGTTWMFAVAGLRPYFGGMAIAIPDQPGPSPEQNLLLLHLDEIETRPDVRDAVRENGVEYVIVGDGRLHRMYGSPGFDDLVDNPAFELVDQVGEARLYRIDVE